MPRFLYTFEGVGSTVSRHESELGSFERIERDPDPRLRGIAHRYCGYFHGAGAQRLRRREVAQDQVTIILDFGPPLYLAGPRSELEEHHSFVAALTDTYAVIEHGALHGIQIDLSPVGAHMLLGVPMHELSAQLVVPLADVIGSGAPEMVERLYEAPGWDARFALLDRYIAARLRDAPPPPADVTYAWQRLTATGGRLRIGELARELGCSRRHLAARFAEQIGPPPKTAARVIRFQHAVRRLGCDDGSRFAEIAQDCGYYDQAHLGRDFRELGGTTPGALVASMLPGGFGVAA